MKWEKSHKIANDLKVIEETEEYIDWYARIKVPKPWWQREVIFRRYGSFSPHYSQIIGFSIDKDVPIEHGVVRAIVLCKFFFKLTV
jgi:hypothetical protein